MGGRRRAALRRRSRRLENALKDRGGARDEQDHGDGAQERGDGQASREAGAEQRARDRAGGTDPEERPVDPAGQMPDEAGGTDADADDEVRADGPSRLLADPADESRQAERAEDESDEPAEHADQRTRRDGGADVLRIARGGRLAGPRAQKIDAEGEQRRPDHDA